MNDPINPRRHPLPYAVSSTETANTRPRTDFSALPSDHNHITDFVEIKTVENDSTSLPTNSEGLDYSTFIKGDATGQIQGNHHRLYIEGDLANQATLQVRDAVISANALRQGSKIVGGYLLILSDYAGSLQSLLQVAVQDRPRVIIETTPENRMAVFARLSGMVHKAGTFECVSSNLNNLPNALSSLSQDGLISRVIVTDPQLIAKLEGAATKSGGDSFGALYTRFPNFLTEICRTPVLVLLETIKKAAKSCLFNGAQEETRTPTPLRALAPEASASTNSATWAMYRGEQGL